MGTLYLVATPIGNLEDITLRAIRILFTVSVVACEDTRRSGQLLHELKTRYGSILSSHLIQGRNIEEDHVRSGMTTAPKLISYYDEVEEKKLPELIGMLESGIDIALISDAGTPLISDPGFRIVRECIKRDIHIESIPGASSVMTALTSSGFPTNQFYFLGFFPQQSNKRKKIFESLSTTFSSFDMWKPTFVAFESANRIKSTLEDMQQILGNISVVISRELTKIHEEYHRGTISELLPTIDTVKGEVVLLFIL